MSDARRYSDDDVRAIIERALVNAPTPGDLTHDDLLAVGQQVGLSAEAMTRAAEDVRVSRLETAATRALSSRRRWWLGGHAGLFALINGSLFAVNYLTTPGQWWALFPIFFWGLALALHTAIAWLTPLSGSAVSRERRRIEAKAAADSRFRVADATSAVEGRHPKQAGASAEEEQATRRA